MGKKKKFKTEGIKILKKKSNLKGKTVYTVVKKCLKGKIVYIKSIKF